MTEDENVVRLFKIPDVAVPFTHLFLNPKERHMVLLLEGRAYAPEELRTALGGSTTDANALIASAYSRGVLNKELDDKGKVLYRSATFYVRLAFFAQYEPDIWAGIPQKDREKIDSWYVEQYMEGARPRLEAALRGEGVIENASFFTLQETLDLIDSLDFDPYVVPCNCKSVAMNCERPRNVCLLFGRGINSEWDRGHGKELSKKEAKELMRMADRSGLMHTSEAMNAICSCCGCCCYPIRSSKQLGTRGLWPIKRYSVHWDANKCIGCGKCVRVCNFGAFTRAEGKVRFDPTACWGCTICSSNCPVGAISLEKIQGPLQATILKR